MADLILNLLGLFGACGLSIGGDVHGCTCWKQPDLFYSSKGGFDFEEVAQAEAFHLNF